MVFKPRPFLEHKSAFFIINNITSKKIFAIKWKWDRLVKLDDSTLINNQFACFINLMGQVSCKEIKWIINILSV